MKRIIYLGNTAALCILLYVLDERCVGNGCLITFWLVVVLMVMNIFFLLNIGNEDKFHQLDLKLEKTKRSKLKMENKLLKEKLAVASEELDASKRA